MILLDTTWCSQICDDLHWMWQRLQHTTELLAPSEHFRQWDYLFRFHRSYWRKLVNRAVRLSIMKTQDARNLIDFHAQIFDLLQEHGALAYAASQVSKPRPQGLFGCVACQRSCRNAAGEGAHMFRVHGRINGLRYLFDGTACPACLKEYHTHGHLLAHLRSQTNCQEQLRARHLHCDPAPGIGSTANRRLAAQHNGLIPYQHGQGPLPEVCVPCPPRQEDAAFYDFVCEFILQAPQASLQDLCTRFVEGARGHRISWTSLQATLQAVQANLTAQDFAQCALAESDVLDLLALLGSPEPWPMFQQATRDAVPLDEDLNYFEHWLEQLLNLEDPWQRYAPTVPRLFYQERVFLHAFSGRRRHGDLQWYLEAAFQQRPDVMLTVVSMDLVVDAEWGDISKSTTRAFWFNAAAQGYITGFLAGPPCCTWSQARGRQLTETDRMGPRIIRNKDELWGFLSVSLREQLALTDGNLLLGFSVLILYRAPGRAKGRRFGLHMALATFALFADSAGGRADHLCPRATRCGLTKANSSDEPTTPRPDACTSLPSSLQGASEGDDDWLLPSRNIHRPCVEHWPGHFCKAHHSRKRMRYVLPSQQRSLTVVKACTVGSFKPTLVLIMLVDDENLDRPAAAVNSFYVREKKNIIYLRWRIRRPHLPLLGQVYVSQHHTLLPSELLRGRVGMGCPPESRRGLSLSMQSFYVPWDRKMSVCLVGF